jgi:hypothetical protein
MRQFSRIAILTGLAIHLAGCAPIVLVALAVGQATAPGPLTTIDVVWESEPGVCEALIGGDPREAYLQGKPTRYYSTASTKPPSETVVSNWQRKSSDASFLVLAGTREPRPGPGSIGRSIDAARSYFDFNHDGAADLVYEVAGPPQLTIAYVILPGNDRARFWFESRLGRLSPNWRDEVMAHDGQVLELPKTDQDRLSAADRPVYAALPDFAVLRENETSYVLIWERDLQFDPARSTPPLSLGNTQTDADAAKAATVAAIYSVGPDFELTRRCEILSQFIGIFFGGF